MKKFQITILCALASACIATPAVAGESSGVSNSIQSAAERELARRQQEVTHAKSLIDDGDAAMKDKDYETATNQYQAAADALRDSPATHALRTTAIDKFCDATVKLAMQRMDEGHWAEAKRRLQVVFDDKYTGTPPDPMREKLGGPAHSARVLLTKLEDPLYFNQTVTPKFRENIEIVKQKFIEAQGFYDTGRFDLAFKRCDEILNIDPYNIAARKMQEKINSGPRESHAIASYNETRSRALWQVQNGWANQPRRYGTNKVVVLEQQPTEKVGTAGITKKLNEIILPTVKFDNATIREAIDYLKKKSMDIDPEHKGVNIVLQLEGAPGSVPDASAPAPAVPGAPDIPGAPGAAPAIPGAAAQPGVASAETRITLSLANIPLIEALKYVTSLSNLKYKIEPYAVSVVPAYVNVDVLVTKEYKVPPGFISASPAGAASSLAAPAPGPVAPGAPAGGTPLVGRASARDYLEGRGVTFPPGSSAIFIPTSSRLVVRNTQQNLDLVDAIVDASWQALPSQVDIEAKFVEINQNNLKELDFDWLLGQFNLPGSSKVFAGGGTPGNTSQSPSASDYPFTPPGGTPIGGNPVTAGNRSGSTAISANAISALLAGTGAAGASQLAPGIFSLAGVFTDPQFQLVIRALNQKQGIDLLCAPRVTTKSGQKAVIEVVQEFRYPTEFQPPQIPTNVGASTTAVTLPGTTTQQSSIPITPTTPTAFETRKVGVTLEVEPVVGSDGQTIDLNLQPEVVEFQGFINYGSPILSPPQTNALGMSTLTDAQRVLTPNIINQPIFSTRKVQTNVTLWDGQTVVIGGLIREDVQKVEDKTPLLGDIPFVGRLFRSSADQHIKKNLMIFLTARLVNPAGDSIHGTDEEEEMAETFTPPAPPAPAGLPEPGFNK